MRLVGRSKDDGRRDRRVPAAGTGLADSSAILDHGEQQTPSGTGSRFQKSKVKNVPQMVPIYSQKLSNQIFGLHRGI